MSDILVKRADAELDKAGRVIVRPDLSLTGYPNIFVIGDPANFSHQDYEPLPGLAAVAMQEGSYVARLIKRQLQGKSLPPFRYRDKGKISIIGRNAAVIEIGSWRLSGFVAWLMWVFVHIYYLIGFDNRILVLFQWAWSYFTSGRGTRLITNETSFKLVESETEKIEVKP